MALLFGVIVGFALGLTGGGGSIFALPLLIYGLNVAVHDAVALSLAAVALTAASGAVSAMRAQLVDYRVGLIFAGAGMLAAPVGMRVAQRIPEAVLLPLFALLMLVVAISLWRRAVADPVATTVVRADFRPLAMNDSGPICRLRADRRLLLTTPCAIALAATGLVTGLLSGLFGVGGGFVIVPALLFATQIDIHRAVATSLFVISLIGASAVAASLLEGRQLPWAIAGYFVAGGFAGMLAGRMLARRIAGPRLQKLFAIAMAMVALAVLSSKLVGE